MNYYVHDLYILNNHDPQQPPQYIMFNWKLTPPPLFSSFVLAMSLIITKIIIASFQGMCAVRRY